MGPPRGLPPMGRPVGTTAQRGSNARISWPPGQGKIWGQEARRGPKTKLAETSLANGPGQDARPPGHRRTGCRAPGPKATEKGHVYGPAHSRLQRTVQRALATPGRNRGAEPMGPRHHGAGPPHQRATEKKTTYRNPGTHGYRGPCSANSPGPGETARGPGARARRPPGDTLRAACTARVAPGDAVHTPQGPGAKPGGPMGGHGAKGPRSPRPKAHRRHATGGVHSKDGPGKRGAHTPGPRTKPGGPTGDTGPRGPGARAWRPT